MGNNRYWLCGLGGLRVDIQLTSLASIAHGKTPVGWTRYAKGVNYLWKNSR